MTKIRMNVCLLLVLLLVVILLTGCGNQGHYTESYFDYAIINTFDGKSIEGNVASWNRGEDRIQITFTDGSVYYTHFSNVILIKGE